MVYTVYFNNRCIYLLISILYRLKTMLFITFSLSERGWLLPAILKVSTRDTIQSAVARYVYLSTINYAFQQNLNSFVALRCFTIKEKSNNQKFI